MSIHPSRFFPQRAKTIERVLGVGGGMYSTFVPFLCLFSFYLLHYSRTTLISSMRQLVSGTMPVLCAYLV